MLAVLLALHPGLAASQEPSCDQVQVTGYVRGEHSDYTFDGTSVWTSEPIAAASWEIPLQAYVRVEGIGTYRIADRGGGLDWRRVDILVDTREQAYALTSRRLACWPV